MITRRCWCTFPSMLALARLLPGRAETVSPPVLSLTSTITLDALGDPSHGLWKWSHGAFVYAVWASGLSPTFYTFNREGKFVSSATPQVPEVTGVSLLAFDRDPDGSLVYSGWSASVYGQPQPFLIYLSAEGQTTQILPTAPYWPYMVTIALDGTIWTLGYEWVRPGSSPIELKPGAGVLRHFDRTGKLIHSGLPQSRFPTPRQRRCLSSGFFVALPYRLVWYAPGFTPLQGPGEYVEIAPDNFQLQSYPGVPPPTKDGWYVGFAITDAGEVFVSYEDQTQPYPQTPNYHRRRLYRFDRAASDWTPESVPAFGKYPDPQLIGADGEQLVFRSGDSAAFLRVSL